MERKGDTVVIEAPSGSNATVGKAAFMTTQNDSMKTAI
jgi:adenosine/AMP kinase